MRATDHRRDATENHWVHVSKSGVAEQRVVFFQVLSLVSWNASRPWAYQCTPLDLVARVRVKSGYFNIYSPVRYTYSSVLRKYLTFKDFCQFGLLLLFCCLFLSLIRKSYNVLYPADISLSFVYRWAAEGQPWPWRHGAGHPPVA